MIDSNRDVKDIQNELALWKNLSRQQDKLLVAYRLGRHPGEVVLSKIEKYRKALEPYVQNAILR